MACLALRYFHVLHTNFILPTSNRLLKKKKKFHKAYLFHLAGITISSALLLGEPRKVEVTAKKLNIFAVILWPSLAKLGVNIVATSWCTTQFLFDPHYKTSKDVVKSVDNNTILNKTSVSICVRTEKDKFGITIFLVNANETSIARSQNSLARSLDSCKCSTHGVPPWGIHRFLG